LHWYYYLEAHLHAKLALYYCAKLMLNLFNCKKHELACLWTRLVRWYIPCNFAFHWIDKGKRGTLKNMFLRSFVFFSEDDEEDGHLHLLFLIIALSSSASSFFRFFVQFKQIFLLIFIYQLIDTYSLVFCCLTLPRS